jgi:hypothetical protein
VQFGRSLGANKQIQIDSDSTLIGGVLPTHVIERNASNVISFIQGRISGKQDVELDFAEYALAQMVQHQ